MAKIAEKVDTYVYINGFAGSAGSKLRKVAQLITDPGIVQIYTREALRKSAGRPSHIIVDGGEGTNLVVTQWMFDIGLPCAVGLLKGGTQNVLYNEVAERGVMTIEKFRRTEVDKFPKESLFHPGQVGEKVVFNNQLGIGVYERWMGELNECLKFLPSRELRTALARVTPVFIAIYGEPKLDLFTVVERVGKIPLFRGQGAFDGNVTHAYIETWFNLVKSLRLGRRLRKNPQYCLPQDIMKREQQESFEVEIKGGSVWIDGDTINGSQMKEHPYNSLKGFQTVRRSDFAFPLVALRG